MKMVSLDELNEAGTADFVAALGDIYEHSPWVAEAVASLRPFARLADLAEAMAAAVRAVDPERQLALIRLHPDLAGKAARAGALTADSTAEQASAGLDRLSEAEFADFHRLNDAYRARFASPFIVCVRRHSKGSILRQFERRLGNSPQAERANTLSEIFRIAALRLDQRVTAPDRLPVHGRLSTHVLDTAIGRPAGGVGVELYEVAGDGGRRLLTRRITNADGRTDTPLIAGQPLPMGTYELHFAVGDYFAARGAAQGDPAFLGVVPLRFAVAEPEGHYHVPLLVSPWSYSTYRGS